MSDQMGRWIGAGSCDRPARDSGDVTSASSSETYTPGGHVSGGNITQPLENRILDPAGAIRPWLHTFTPGYHLEVVVSSSWQVQ